MFRVHSGRLAIFEQRASECKLGILGNLPPSLAAEKLTDSAKKLKHKLTSGSTDSGNDQNDEHMMDSDNIKTYSTKINNLVKHDEKSHSRMNLTYDH